MPSILKRPQTMAYSTGSYDKIENQPPIFTLRLDNIHLREEHYVKSDVLKIGPCDWVAELSIHTNSNTRSDGKTNYFHHYNLKLSCLLPDDTKSYSCRATIRHGWFTDTGHMGARVPLPFKPSFYESRQFHFTHKTPDYHQHCVFDRGLVNENRDSKLVTYLQIFLEHEDPPVRAPGVEIFGDNSLPWHDLKVICGPSKTELFTSKPILAMVSPVFRKLLYGEFSESGAEKIVLPETSYEDLLELLQYLYPNIRKPISESNICTLLEMADRYLIDSVTQECEKFLLFYDPKRTPANVEPLSISERQTMASRYRLKKVQQECEREELARTMQQGCSVK